MRRLQSLWRDHSLIVVLSMILVGQLVGCWLTLEWASNPDKVSSFKAYIGLLFFSIVADTYGAWLIVIATIRWREKKSGQGQ